MSANKKHGKNMILDQLSLPGKLQYLWDYYKLHLAIAAILIYVLIFSVYRHASQKDTVLYAAMVNIAASEELVRQFSDDFLKAQSLSPSDYQMAFYKGLYLTDDTSSQFFEYTHASQVKILAAIDAEQMDVVFLNKEAFDAFAQNGYLYNLKLFFSEYPDAHEDLVEKISPDLVSNMEIKEDNAKEIALDESVEYQSVTDEYPMGIDVSQTKFIHNAGFTDTVYLAILANTPRSDAVYDYLEYLYSK